jgi:GMP synthase-like glutamine amidotransferase
MMKFKIFVVGSQAYYASWLNCVVVDSIAKADIVMFTGGADVDTLLYGEARGSLTFCEPNRDIFEKKMYEAAREKNKPMIGICRGAQFLTVMNGGRLIQDVNGHSIRGVHDITFDDGDKIQITSTHHQMCYPFDLPRDEYKLIAWSSEKRSDKYLNGLNKDIVLSKDFVEPEIIYYPKTKCLGIQGHPEALSIEGFPKTLTKLNNLVHELFVDQRVAMV